jgi:hypothetical protein
MGTKRLRTPDVDVVGIIFILPGCTKPCLVFLPDSEGLL